jgi:hypothetical protein
MPGDWSRPFWQPSERNASLFYFVVGEPPVNGLNVSRSRHHVDPDFDGLQRIDMSGQQRSDNPDWFGAFFDPHGLGHDIDAQFGEPANELRAAQRGTIVRAEFPDPQSLDYLRNTIGMVSAVLEQGGVAVFEMHQCRWWTRGDWTRRFIERSCFEITDHISITATDDARYHPGLWSHTRGMRKFGRPDLQIKHLPGPWSADNAHANMAGAMLNDFADKLARGKVIPDGRTMRYDQDAGAFVFVETPDDSDTPTPNFNNCVLEIVDYDPEARQRGQGLNRLLSEMVAKEGG